MRILYDHQAFAHQDYGGITRYFSEVISEINHSSEFTVDVSLLFSNNINIKNIDVCKASGFFPNINFKGKRFMMVKINQILSSHKYIYANHDIFHPTYYDSYYLRFKKRKPTALTCHDLIHEKFLLNDRRTISNKRKTISEADIIFTVSNNTKSDLIEYYQVPEDRIFVTHLASSLPYLDLKYLRPPKEYILFVGHRDSYKNFSFFIKAVSPLLIKNKSIKVYCAGGGRFSKKELQLFNELKVIESLRYFPILDDNLTKLYAEAIAFFFPSIYEGFGIPILEAMSCGCPVAASKTSSLPEVAGDAAVFFDPYDSESILSTAEMLYNSNSIRDSLIERGRLRCSEFSWKKTTEATLEGYRRII